MDELARNNFSCASSGIPFSIGSPDKGQMATEVGRRGGVNLPNGPKSGPGFPEQSLRKAHSKGQ